MPRKVQVTERALERADAKARALAKSSGGERPDVEVMARVRLRLAQEIERDLPFWYARAKYLAENAERTTDPQVRMVTAMINKILADRVEKTAGAEKPATTLLLQINGLNRGPKELRVVNGSAALPEPEFDETVIEVGR